VFPLGHAMLPAGAVHLLQRRGHLAGWDVRVVMLGALLPDFVDKPLSWLGLVEARHGHWVGHSLLAALALLALALALRSRAPRGLALAAGTATHSLLDRLPWTEPQAWLWPLLGPFPQGSFGDPLASLASSAWMLGGEVLGAAVLAWLAWDALRDRSAASSQPRPMRRNAAPNPGGNPRWRLPDRWSPAPSSPAGDASAEAPVASDFHGKL
jgi:hypothetical protein